MASNEFESTVTRLLQSGIADTQAPRSNLSGTLSTLAGTGGSNKSAIDNAAAVLAGAVDGLASAGGNGLDESVERLTRQIGELMGVTGLQADSTQANTSAVIENSLAQNSGGGGSAAGDVGKSILSFLSGGLGLVQLLGGLFGGDSSEPTTVLPGYTLPAAVDINAGLGGLITPSVQPVRYGQDGLARVATGDIAGAAPTITVQVNAMDSRSFLDHSDDIARAVKEAMLNSHSLNDVVTEL